MYKDKIFYVTKGNLYNYFTQRCKEYKNMYNVTNFYIRNCMTGLKKTEKERQPNELDVLNIVFENIEKLNQDGKDISLPTKEKWFLSYNTLDTIFKLSKNKDYYNLPAQVNQNAIKECVQKWCDYFLAIKDYKKYPSKYTGKPRLPKYIKNDMKTIVFTNITCKLKSKDDKTCLRFPKTKENLNLGKYISSNAKLMEVKVKPIHQVFEVHLIIKEEDPIQIKKEPKNIIAIDLGVTNFATISNNIGLSPIIIKGNVMKSRNQWFNKKIGHYTSILKKGKTPTESDFTSKRIANLYFLRKKYFRDYFHKVSNSIIEYCITNNIDTIVIGKNEQWKSNINIGHRNNQTFCYIPHELFISKLDYKCKLNNINYIIKEESYTSKASFLDFDVIPSYEKGNKEHYSFSGKRIHRGLYKTNNNIIINADINGSSNILRKEFPNAFDNITNFNYLLQPICWKSNKWYQDKKCKMA